MAATQQEPDPIDSMEALNAFTEDLAEQSASAETLKEQPLPSKEDKLIPPTSSMNSSKDVPYHPGSLDISADQAGAYPPNLYAPQAQAIYYGGFENPAGEWDILPQYLNVEAMEVGPTGTYNDNPSMMLAYGYTPQMPYGPYSPVTTPLPSSTGDGQLYSPQQFSYPGPYYQQPVPHSMAYMTSPAPVSQADLSIPVNTRGAFLADNLNSNSMPLGPRPSYSFPHGSVGRGSITGNSASHGFYDMRQGFDGFGSAGFWSDWLKSPEGSGSLTPLPSPSASPQPIGAIGSYGHNVTPLASGLACHQQRPLYSYGSLISSYDRGYGHGEVYHGSNFGGFIAGLGTNSRSLIAFDKVRRRGKGNASLCSCNGAFDFLNEQNRGPRATRLKNPATEQSAVESKKENSTAVPEHELYNRPEFVTEYKDAKFFIIKSYSEDNVHKSIKYGVWASTANGNKKLDAAYHEAKGKEELSPVFLFFSVNASAQFCGVAEMIGPVDFERSVDYWQQDKWSGQFPVKWHIVKDVPNNLFRHIILENNDNKPVTNSRDTQEVKLEQGLEMLNIFKTYETEMSILDDFDFYETREKAMQERKARQQQQQQQSNLMGAAVVAAGGDGHQIPVPISGDYVNQMTKTFAQVVRLEGSNTENSTAEKNDSSAAAAAAAKPEELKKPSTATETNSS